ncbi:unnamed protein product [Didymodactylos carnosus]|uniref:Cytochrome P450 n=1 Tax=Didymodactylos carnosus TaxID=1234261 RepID=A0A815AIV8_9BILA|nr:unnamed protein product [Didymodactylos carnosus]CAF4031639.1 unnamed protein product [Didymodactylos carnosus]
MLLTIILLTIIICLLLTYVLILLNRYQYFKQRNIPTPPYRFFFGHLKTLWNAQLKSKQLQEWTKIYGKIYSLFEGSTPVYVVSDVNLLQEIFIKQISNFNARKLTLTPIPPTSPHASLLITGGNTWKRQRQVTNPTFTTTKLKQMSALIKDCVDAFMSKLPRHCDSGEEFNIYALYKRMTMDVIFRCAFAVDTDMQTDTENIYLKRANNYFSPEYNRLPILKLRFLIAEIDSFLCAMLDKINLVKRKLKSLISSIHDDDRSRLYSRIEDVIKMRSDKAKQRVDLLQLLLDAQKIR